MAASRNSADQYLQKVGGTYYARVRVPRTLEKYTGQSHIRRSLGTGSRTEANLAKHAVVSRIKAELAQLRAKPPLEGQPAGDYTFETARLIKERIDELLAKGDQDQAESIEMHVQDVAEKIERLYGTSRARSWHRLATSNEASLSELMDQWLSTSDYKESTKSGHRNAMSELLAFLDDPGALPRDVTRARAIEFLDKHLTQRNLAHSTIRDRLVSLGGFWGWMASRNAVPDGVNPWSGHRLSKKQNVGTRPPKRTFTDGELVALLKGNDTVKAWPTYSYLPDLIVLGLYTGAREEELCSLHASNVEVAKAHAIINVTDAKTKAGLRPVGVVHPAAMAVIKRRLAVAKAKGASGLLFPELKPGGLDGKYSFSAVKAFGRYRRTCGVPDGTDFHSFRRNVITVLEHARVSPTEVARFVGHKLGTMAGDTYSAGASRDLAVETARKVKHAKAVETAITRVTSA